MEDLQKNKNRTTTSVNDSSSENISKGNENYNLKICLYPMSIVALFMIANTWKQSECQLIDEWMKK